MGKYTSETGRSGVLDVALVIIGTILAGIVILVLVQSTRPAASSQSIVVIEATPLAPAADLTVITEGDVTIYVPPNAIDKEGSIAIVPPDPAQLVTDNTDWIRTRVIDIEFLDPDGATVPDLSLLRPIEVCFSLTEEQWQDLSMRPGFYQVQYYAEQKTQPRWENLPRVLYPDDLQLCGQTYHLSLFSVAIMLQPEVPVTGPTVTLTATPTNTAVPRIQPSETRERKKRDTPVPTNPPPTDAPTQPPPTNPPPTQPPPTNPPPTDAPTQPPPTNPPPTQPPPTNPPPTNPPPPEPPRRPTNPPPPEPDPTEPSETGGNNGNNGNGPPPGHGPPGGPPGQNKP